MGELLSGDLLDQSAEATTRRVRTDCAARQLLMLRQALAARDRAARLNAAATYRVRRAERRAQAALSRARFTDPAVAAEVLRLVQVLILTQTLAGLDYATADDAQRLLASLITPGTVSAQAADGQISPASQARQPRSVTVDAAFNGYPAASGLNGASAVPAVSPASDGLMGLAPPGTGHRAPQSHAREPADGHGLVVDVAARIVADARARGVRLSQAELARQVRAEGHGIANDRLRWLASVSGLRSDEDRT